jgi:hypothetical protein
MLFHRNVCEENNSQTYLNSAAIQFPEEAGDVLRCLNIDANVHFTQELLTGSDPLCACANARIQRMQIDLFTPPRSIEPISPITILYGGIPATNESRDSVETVAVCYGLSCRVLSEAIQASVV